jgi:N-acetylglucosamine kinase-like BadF-type ATPase
VDDVVVSQIHKIFPSQILNQKNIEIDFYTAGLTNYTSNKIKFIFHKYFQLESVNVFSDLLASSRALFNKCNGIVCILGTGSNCAYFNGKKNEYITNSLGHLLGDEGSGYDLGKIFLRYYFQNKIPLHLKSKFEQHENMNQDEILSAIYMSSNQKFHIASFAKFLKNHESNSIIKTIIRNSFLNFLNTHPFTFPEFNKYKFGFSGSIAFHFKEIIGDILAQKDIDYIILEKPIKNLVEYYN